MSVGTRVRDYIRENFLFGSDVKIDDHDSLLERGVIDSTGAMELVSFLETEFRVEVSDHDLVPENLDSVAAIASFVARKRAQQETPAVSATAV